MITQFQTRSRTSLLLLVAVALAGCTVTLGGIRGSGDMITETREVSGFTEVVLEGSGEVQIEIGVTESLTIEADDNLMEYLTSDVRNGRLTLGTRQSISPTRGIVYTVTAKSLDGVAVSGSGNVAAAGVVSEDFVADIDGSGRIELSELETGLFEASISGSGNIEVGGTADHLAVSIPGSGTFEGEDLVAVTGDVDISGSGAAVVYVSDELEASLSGSGVIEYLGDPQVVSDISGSGIVRPR